MIAGTLLQISVSMLISCFLVIFIFISLNYRPISPLFTALSNYFSQVWVERKLRKKVLVSEVQRFPR